MNTHIIKGSVFTAGLFLAFLNPIVGGAIILSVVGSYAFENYLSLKGEFQAKQLEQEHQKELLKLTVIEQEKFDRKLQELSAVVIELKTLRLSQEPVIKALLEGQTKVRTGFNNMANIEGL